MPLMAASQIVPTAQLRPHTLEGKRFFLHRETRAILRVIVNNESLTTQVRSRILDSIRRLPHRPETQIFQNEANFFFYFSVLKIPG